MKKTIKRHGVLFSLILLCTICFMTAPTAVFAQNANQPSEGAAQSEQVQEGPVVEVAEDGTPIHEYTSEDACTRLNDIPEWTEGLQNISTLVTSGKFEEAKAAAQDLQNICERSPVLNYVQGRIYEGLQDLERAKQYFQNASMLTLEFAVAPEITQKIWYARYESEHREDFLKAEADKKELSEVKLELDETKGKLESTKMVLWDNQDETKRHNRNLMWAGVGLGIGGLALTGTGLGLAMTAKTEDAYSVIQNKKIKPKASYTVEWSLVGVGAAFTVTGVILTGVFGYRYTHAKENETYSMVIGPSNASFVMNF